MTPAPFHAGGERFLLCPMGVLAWPSRRTLVASDLHLEKASHFAARGVFLPPYDTRETVAKLALAIRRHSPQRLVLLGDSFHDAEGCTRMHASDATALRHALSQVDEVVWILGNHDPLPPEDLPGTAAEWLTDGAVTFRHEASRQAAPGVEVSGHFHPKATMPTRVGGVTRPCFVGDARRIILPSFGTLTGGLDVREPAIGTLFPRGGRAFLLGTGRLFSAPVSPMRGRASPIMETHA
ncbi:ligase-associated DNA damage response endonuclease PdeM [Roseomonas sp. CCTCC AB2023176]|uniref:ligase-associated DNA damage response endonuclease PdeM n=1 Tax=Roseomonas sp. CCTCC AB2023176 TaxID=3342640 RepID=UPI0035DE6566